MNRFAGKLRDWAILLKQLPGSLLPVLFGLALAMALLALAIVQTISTQREARQHALHETDSLLALREVMTAVLDAETGQRGYLLTLRESYLDPLEKAKQRIVSAQAFLHESFVNTPYPGERQPIARLTDLVDDKIAELDRTVELTRIGRRDQALAVLQSDVGSRTMDQIRSEMQRLSGVAEAQRKRALERAKQSEDRLLPLLAVLGFGIAVLVLLGFAIERRRGLAEAEATQADALRAANERNELLARELNHRVNNLFSVILSIVALSGRRPGDAREVVADIRDRIHALSRAHSISQGANRSDAFPLREIVETTMAPYATSDGSRLNIQGPEIALPVRAITPVGLILHELATNAAKYGALSRPDGHVDIGWERCQTAAASGEICLSWIETAAAALIDETGSPLAAGFGSTMMTLAARQLGGRFEREWPAEGAVVRIFFAVD